MDQKLIENTICYVKELFAEDGGAHDASHTMRVYRNAKKILETEKGADEELVLLGALLHDADDHKLFHTVNNANARSFLVGQGLNDERIDRICTIINGVSFSQNQGRKPESLEGMIVQDADRLDAVGAIAIARTFAYGGEHRRSMESNIQHFYDKLLKLRDLMNTDSARELAKERHAFMLEFLRHYKEETEE